MCILACKCSAVTILEMEKAAIHFPNVPWGEGLTPLKVTLPEASDSYESNCTLFPPTFHSPVLGRPSYVTLEVQCCLHGTTFKWQEEFVSLPSCCPPLSCAGFSGQVFPVLSTIPDTAALLTSSFKSPPSVLLVFLCLDPTLVLQLPCIAGCVWTSVSFLSSPPPRGSHPCRWDLDCCVLCGSHSHLVSQWLRKWRAGYECWATPWPLKRTEASEWPDLAVFDL